MNKILLHRIINICEKFLTKHEFYNFLVRSDESNNPPDRDFDIVEIYYQGKRFDNIIMVTLKFGGENDISELNDIPLVYHFKELHEELLPIVRELNINKIIKEN
tara:strand:- start:71296 stop:71607 length:312 start_codon:yes stop_codon:yes gene_type:complete